MKRNDWTISKSVGNILSAAKTRESKLPKQHEDRAELRHWIHYLEYRAKLPCGVDQLLDLDIDDLELFGLLERV